MIALSWSRLKDFQECPRKFHLKYITKSFPKEGKSIHLEKGDQLHKQMEQYIMAKNGHSAMPLGFSPEVRDTIHYADKLWENFHQIFPEAQIACRLDWSPIDWFGGDEVAWRAILDVTAIRTVPSRVFVGDWKSGKIYPYGEGFGQLHLSAAIVLKRFAEMERVDSAYVYMEHKVVTKIVVTRDKTDEVDANGRPVPHLAQVTAHFESEFDRVQMEKNYDPTPNENCKWCPATRGQCQYSRKL